MLAQRLTAARQGYSLSKNSWPFCTSTLTFKNGNDIHVIVILWCNLPWFLQSIESHILQLLGRPCAQGRNRPSPWVIYVRVTFINFTWRVNRRRIHARNHKFKLNHILNIHLQTTLPCSMMRACCSTESSPAQPSSSSFPGCKIDNFEISLITEFKSSYFRSPAAFSFEVSLISRVV